jgi:hypothetical protein
MLKLERQVKDERRRSPVRFLEYPPIKTATETVREALRGL